MLKPEMDNSEGLFLQLTQFLCSNNWHQLLSSIIFMTLNVKSHQMLTLLDRK